MKMVTFFLFTRELLCVWMNAGKSKSCSCWIVSKLKMKKSKKPCPGGLGMKKGEGKLLLMLLFTNCPQSGRQIYQKILKLSEWIQLTNKLKFLYVYWHTEAAGCNCCCKTPFRVIVEFGLLNFYLKSCNWSPAVLEYMWGFSAPWPLELLFILQLLCSPVWSRAHSQPLRGVQ